MKFKRTLSLVLSFAMVAAFAGCSKGGTESDEVSYIETIVEEEVGGNTTASGGGSQSGTKGGSQSGNNSQSGTVSEGKKTTEAKKKLDFGGKTITILREWGAYPRGQQTVWDNWNDNVARVKKEFNVNIVEKKWSVDLAQEVLSGVKPEGQLYQVPTSAVYNYAKNGYIADFNSAMEKTGIKMNSQIFNKFNVQLNNINGKQYTAGYGFARVPSVVIFNKTLTEKAGYNIYDLISKKQWTWDKMTEIAKKCTVTNSSGETTQYGLGLGGDAVSALAVSNNSHVAFPDSNGNFTVQFSSEGTRAALQQIYNWIHVDKVAENNWGKKDWTQLGTDFSNKKIAMLFGGHADISAAYTNLKDEWGIAYLPMGPNANNYVSLLIDEYSYVVPAAYSNMTSELLLLLDELYQYPKGYTYDDQFRDEWIRYFKSKEAYNMFKTLHDGSVKQVWDASFKVDMGNSKTSYMAALGNLFEGNVTVGAFVDTYQKTFQTNLNDNMKNIKYTGSLK